MGTACYLNAISRKPSLWLKIMGVRLVVVESEAGSLVGVHIPSSGRTCSGIQDLDFRASGNGASKVRSIPSYRLVVPPETCVHVRGGGRIDQCLPSQILASWPCPDRQIGEDLHLTLEIAVFLVSSVRIHKLGPQLSVPSAIDRSCQCQDTQANLSVVFVDPAPPGR